MRVKWFIPGVQSGIAVFILLKRYYTSGYCCILDGDDGTVECHVLNFRRTTA